jgi:hypothetical protein
MTDDIVTRLRKIVHSQTDTWDDSDITEDDLIWAADEIERLREELQASQDALRAWIQMLGKK